MVPQRVKKRVSDTDLVNIGQLDHYVVFGTKFGPVHDFAKKLGQAGQGRLDLQPLKKRFCKLPTGAIQVFSKLSNQSCSSF